MKTIVLISCVSKKLSVSAKAKELYKSALFNKSLEYAKNLNPDEIYILSAKYHLVKLDDVIEPYDLTLNKLKKEEKRKWGEEVIQQLEKVADLKQDKFIILAGKNYIEPIKHYLTYVVLPLAGMKIGERLQYLDESKRGGN